MIFKFTNPKESLPKTVKKKDTHPIHKVKRKKKKTIRNIKIITTTTNLDI